MSMIGTVQPIHGADPLRPAGPVTSLEKMWQAVHFLLTGDPWEGSGPLAEAVLGGTEIGADEGYGPPRVHAPERVKTLAAVLQALDEHELRARFDPQAFEDADVYPSGMWDEDEHDLWEEVRDALRDLRAAYVAAAAAGHGIVLRIT